MKKLFLIFKNSPKHLFKGITQGKFKGMQLAKQGEILLVELSKIKEGEPEGDYVPSLNAKMKLVTEGDNETGEGYILEAIVPNQAEKVAVRTYLKASVVLSDWNNGTIVIQVCDVNGVVANATQSTDATNPTEASNVGVFELALEKEPLTGTTDLSREQLIAASEGDGKLQVVLTDSSGKEYDAVNVEGVSGTTSSFKANSKDNVIIFIFTAVGEEVLFEADLKKRPAKSGA